MSVTGPITSLVTRRHIDLMRCGAAMCWARSLGQTPPR